jgi:hypothetical protein
MDTKTTYPNTLSEITKLYDPLIANIEQYFLGMYQTRNAKGEIDFDVMRTYVSYNIGENYLRVNSLVLQAQHILADLQGKLQEARVSAIDDIKRGRNARGYDLSSTETKDMIDGHVNVIACQRALNKQTSIVKYLQNQLEALKYFPNNARVLMDMHKTIVEYGSSAR